MRRARNCDGDHPLKTPLNFSGHPFDRCPLATIDAFTLKAIRKAHDMEAGFLPRSGGMDRQPVRLLRAMRTYLSEKYKLENEQRK